jgi:hypothetical protein
MFEWVSEVSRGLNDIRDEGFLDIYTGEGYWKLYSDPAIVKSFEQLAHRKARVRVIASPVLSVYETANGERMSGLLDLAEKGFIELYQRETRGSHSHYSIGEGKNGIYLRIESPHRAAASFLERRTIELSPQEVEERAKELKQHFESELSKSRRSYNPREDFLLMTDVEIAAVQDLAIDVLKKSFSDLKKDELAALLKDYQRQRNEAAEQIREDLIRAGILTA